MYDPNVVVHQFFMALIIGDILLFILVMFAGAAAFVLFLRQFFTN